MAGTDILAAAVIPGVTTVKVSRARLRREAAARQSPVFAYSEPMAQAFVRLASAAILGLFASRLSFCQEVVHLWQNGAPGFEKLKDEPEEAKDYWVKHVNNPSIAVYLPPKELATGAAVIIAPGGGHSVLVYGPEGVEPAKFFNKLGVAAFVLKYRLEREPGSPYKIVVHAKQDAYRAIRLVRSRAAEWSVDPNRVGIVGFSAGGEVASLVSYESAMGDSSAPDPVDRQNGKPNFQVLIYPGPVGVPDRVPSDAPPTFMLVSNDDAGHSDVIVDLISKFRAAKVPMEAHILEQGGHGFNLGTRSKLKSVNKWPDRLADWLGDSGFLRPPSQ
jgi:acetyl esterase/lipase